MRSKKDRGLYTIPVSNKTLILAEVTEEASIVQVHDGVFLPSDVDVHRQPVICQVALKRPVEERESVKFSLYELQLVMRDLCALNE